MDCSIALVAPASAPTNPTLAYNTGTPTSQVGSWTDFMQNSDATNCGITSCLIKRPACNAAYVPGELSIAGSSPWAITANQNIQAGYTETICVECTNGAEIQIYDNYIIT